MASRVGGGSRNQFLRVVDPRTQGGARKFARRHTLEADMPAPTALLAQHAPAPPGNDEEGNPRLGDDSSDN